MSEINSGLPTADEIYRPKDVVWVKLSAMWWPAEVQDQTTLDPEVTEGLKKAPLTVVKYLTEDSFGFIKSLDHIYHYNCRKKDEFLTNGFKKYRQHKNEKNMAKFPLVVEEAERLTGGEPEKVINHYIGSEVEKSSQSEDRKVKSANRTRQHLSPHSAPVDTPNTSSNEQKPNIPLNPDDDEPSPKKYIKVLRIQRKSPEVKPKVMHPCPLCFYSTIDFQLLLEHIAYKLHFYKSSSGHFSTAKSASRPKPVKKKIRKVENATPSIKIRKKSESAANKESPLIKRRKKAPPNALEVSQECEDILKDWDEDEENGGGEAGPSDDFNNLSKAESDEVNETTDALKHPDGTTNDAQKTESSEKRNQLSPSEPSSCFDFSDDEPLKPELQTLKFGQKLPRVISPDKNKPAVDALTNEHDLDSFLDEVSVPEIPDLPSPKLIEPALMQVKGKNVELHPAESIDVTDNSSSLDNNIPEHPKISLNETITCEDEVLEPLKTSDATTSKDKESQNDKPGLETSFLAEGPLQSRMRKGSGLIEGAEDGSADRKMKKLSDKPSKKVESIEARNNDFKKSVAASSQENFLDSKDVAKTLDAGSIETEESTVSTLENNCKETAPETNPQSPSILEPPIMACSSPAVTSSLEKRKSKSRKSSLSGTVKDSPKPHLKKISCSIGEEKESVPVLKKSRSKKKSRSSLKVDDMKKLNAPATDGDSQRNSKPGIVKICTEIDMFSTELTPNSNVGKLKTPKRKKSKDYKSADVDQKSPDLRNQSSDKTMSHKNRSRRRSSIEDQSSHNDSGRESRRLRSKNESDSVAIETKTTPFEIINSSSTSSSSVAKKKAPKRRPSSTSNTTLEKHEFLEVSKLRPCKRNESDVEKETPVRNANGTSRKMLKLSPSEEMPHNVSPAKSQQEVADDPHFSERNGDHDSSKSNVEMSVVKEDVYDSKKSIGNELVNHLADTHVLEVNSSSQQIASEPVSFTESTFAGSQSMNKVKDCTEDNLSYPEASIPDSNHEQGTEGKKGKALKISKPIHIDPKFGDQTSSKKKSEKKRSSRRSSIINESSSTPLEPKSKKVKCRLDIDPVVSEVKDSSKSHDSKEATIKMVDNVLSLKSKPKKKSRLPLKNVDVIPSLKSKPKKKSRLSLKIVDEKRCVPVVDGGSQTNLKKICAEIDMFSTDLLTADSNVQTPKSEKSEDFPSAEIDEKPGNQPARTTLNKKRSRRRSSIDDQSSHNDSGRESRRLRSKNESDSVVNEMKTTPFETTNSSSTSSSSVAKKKAPKRRPSSTSNATLEKHEFLEVSKLRPCKRNESDGEKEIPNGTSRKMLKLSPSEEMQHNVSPAKSQQEVSDDPHFSERNGDHDSSKSNVEMSVVEEGVNDSKKSIGNELVNHLADTLMVEVNSSFQQIASEPVISMESQEIICRSDSLTSNTKSSPKTESSVVTTEQLPDVVDYVKEMQSSPKSASNDLNSGLSKTSDDTLEVVASPARTSRWDNPYPTKKKEMRSCTPTQFLISSPSKTQRSPNKVRVEIKSGLGKRCFKSPLHETANESTFPTSSAQLLLPSEISVAPDKPAQSDSVASDKIAQSDSVASDKPAQSDSVVSDKPAQSDSVAFDKPSQSDSVVSDKPVQSDSVAFDKPSQSDSVASGKPAQSDSVAFDKPAQSDSETPDQSFDDELTALRAEILSYSESPLKPLEGIKGGDHVQNKDGSNNERENGGEPILSSSYERVGKKIEDKLDEMEMNSDLSVKVKMPFQVEVESIPLPGPRTEQRGSSERTTQSEAALLASLLRGDDDTSGSGCSSSVGLSNQGEVFDVSSNPSNIPLPPSPTGKIDCISSVLESKVKDGSEILRIDSAVSTSPETELALSITAGIKVSSDTNIPSEVTDCPSSPIVETFENNNFSTSSIPPESDASAGVKVLSPPYFPIVNEQLPKNDPALLNQQLDISAMDFIIDPTDPLNPLPDSPSDTVLPVTSSLSDKSVICVTVPSSSDVEVEDKIPTVTQRKIYRARQCHQFVIELIDDEHPDFKTFMDLPAVNLGKDNLVKHDLGLDKALLLRDLQDSGDDLNENKPAVAIANTKIKLSTTPRITLSKDDLIRQHELSRQKAVLLKNLQDSGHDLNENKPVTVVIGNTRTKFSTTPTFVPLAHLPPENAASRSVKLKNKGDLKFINKTVSRPLSAKKSGTPELRDMGEPSNLKVATRWDRKTGCFSRSVSNVSPQTVFDRKTSKSEMNLNTKPQSLKAKPVSVKPPNPTRKSAPAIISPRNIVGQPSSSKSMFIKPIRSQLGKSVEVNRLIKGTGKQIILADQKVGYFSSGKDILAKAVENLEIVPTVDKLPSAELILPDTLSHDTPVFTIVEEPALPQATQTVLTGSLSMDHDPVTSGDATEDPSVSSNLSITDPVKR